MNTHGQFLVFLLLCWSVHGIAQPDWAPEDDQSQSLTLRFEAIGAEQGLPHKTVQALFQDHLGFIWLGTPIGLVKYDGYTFQTYQYERGESDTTINNLATISVNAIAEDPGGDLWLGCRFGAPRQPVLFRFDRETEQLIPYLFDERADMSVIRSDIRQIHIGRGFIWVDADRLFRLPVDATAKHSESEASTPYRVFTDQTWGREGDRVEETHLHRSSIFEDSKGRIWSPGRRGIYEWLPESDSFQFHPVSLPISPQRDQRLFFSHLAETEDGWFLAFPNYDGYLVRFNPEDGSYQVLRDEEYVYASIFLQTTQEKAWIGFPVGRGGIRRLDVTTTRSQEIDLFVEGYDFFPLARILCLMQDRSGAIWAGTRDGPLLKYEPQRNHFRWLRFRPGNPNTLPHNSVNDLKRDQKGDYWITTFGGGLVRWNRGENSFTNFRAGVNSDEGPLSNFLIGLEITPDGKIWFGEGFSAGSYDPATGQFAHYRESGTVFTVFNDTRNRIWLAKYGGGLRLYNSVSNDFSPIGLPHPNNPARKIFPYLGGIFQDSRGDLWLGSYAPWIAGCFRLDPETEHCQFFDLPEAHDFHEDGRGFIWIASVEGLYRFDPEKETFRRYNTENGLPNDVVVAIEEDDHGHLWIATENGLSRFDPVTEIFRNYFQSDGLPGNEFYYPAYKNEQGELFFWGKSGVLYFHPDSLQNSNVLPQLALTGIDLFGEPLSIAKEGPLKKHISVTRRLDLSYWQNDLTLHYAALHYKNPGKNRYRVWLENYDQGWREVGTQRNASYTNLDPGRYTFRVKAANSDGIWNEESTALAIVIHPPWYWNWWSKTLYLFLVTAIVLSIYRFQLNRRLALAEAGRLRELDEVKTRLYTNITHEFRTPLTVIQGVTEQIEAHEEEKELIHRNSQQLLDLINKMLDLSKIEAGKLQPDLIHADILSFLRYVTESFHSLALNQKINLNFYADTEIVKMDYDPEKILQILSNLVSNAIKFTPEYGKVLVTARRVETQTSEELKIFEASSPEVLELKVKDTGIGIPPDQLKHIFDRFYQADASNTRRTEGTGIGLALTKELVELMGGRIDVESDVGVGTTFAVWLPIFAKLEGEKQKAEPAPVQGLGDKQSKVVDTAIEEEIKAMGNDQFTSSISTAGEGEINRTFSPDGERVAGSSLSDAPTLLIVEDNADVRRYLASCLQEEYELSFARNGREGIDIALENIPDLIISDVMMPEVDGFELCQTLKQDDRTSHIPIILLTAKADIDSKLEGLEYGADAYLAKPFHRRELNIRLRKLAELRRRLQARYNQPDFAIEPATRKEDAFVRKVRQLVLEHLDDAGFGPEELSQAVFLSRVQIYRKLKALTGKPTSHFIRQIRLHEGYRLLREGNMNVTEVAYSVGFSSPGYFSKLFSAEFGRPPSQVR